MLTLDYEPGFMPVFRNVAEPLLSGLFISVSVPAVLPVMRYAHPTHLGGARSSMNGAPSILCWESGDHLVVVLMAVSSCALIVLPVPSAVALGTSNGPSRTAAAVGR